MTVLMEPDRKSRGEGADHDDTRHPDRGPGPPRPGPAPLAAQPDGRAARGAPGAVGESAGQGGRAGVAGVREAGPGPGRAVLHRLRLHRGRPDPGSAGAARPAGRCGVSGGSPWPAAPVRGTRLRRGRPGGPGPAGSRYRRDGRRAPRRPRCPAPGPQRDPGARGARRPGVPRTARTRPAAAELRVRAGAGERHPAASPPGPRRSRSWATWCWAPPGSRPPWTGTWTRSG